VRFLSKLLLTILLITLSACASLSPEKRAQAEDIAKQRQDNTLDCEQADHCSLPSELNALGDQAIETSTPEAPKHAVILLDRGQDSLLARLHLIHSAKESIELQTFIFDEDDTGLLTLKALMQAAKRGVKVRIVLDQLYGLSDPNLQAALASYHQNFELRVYRPLFDEAKTQKLEFAAGILFKFNKLNQHMHTKLLLIDHKMAIVGGRNIQDRYFDWNGEYNYRDRDLIVSGQVTQAMLANFESFWQHPKTIRAANLKDVAARLLTRSASESNAASLFFNKSLSSRAQQMDRFSRDSALAKKQLFPYLLWVNDVQFFADLPNKHDEISADRTEASKALFELVSESEKEIILQTPYLVMSRPARQVFRYLQRKETPPRIMVSTNSLAATDAFPVYSLSHKYKRLYLRELGFNIHEFKPFPISAPMDVAAMKSATTGGGAPLAIVGSASGAGLYTDRPLPLKRAGVRVGLHAKSMVVDGKIGVVGSHNFDPRSDNYNTESFVVIKDGVFAQALAASIHRDMLPENAWTIAPREKPPIFSGLNYSLGKLSEKLPIFDVWPFPYATSYDLRPECQPLPIQDPKFLKCYKAVGDFPEVNASLKGIYTRMVTAFGAGLAPIL
jgi:cardiolipin synthase C